MKKTPKPTPIRRVPLSKRTPKPTTAATSTECTAAAVGIKRCGCKDCTRALIGDILK